eukprot:gene1369-11991_t
MSEFEKGVDKLTQAHQESIKELQRDIDLLLKSQEKEQTLWKNELEKEKQINSELQHRKRELEIEYNLSKTKTKILNQNYETLKNQLNINNKTRE